MTHLYFTMIVAYGLLSVGFCAGWIAYMWRKNHAKRMGRKDEMRHLRETDNSSSVRRDDGDR